MLHQLMCVPEEAEPPLDFPYLWNSIFVGVRRSRVGGDGTLDKRLEGTPAQRRSPAGSQGAGEHDCMSMR